MHRRRFLSVAAAALVSREAAGHFRASGPAEYNVVAFGARRDGITDDSGPFTLALAAAARAGGGVVRIPSGHYLLRSTIHPQTGVDVVGDGRESWLDFRVGPVAGIANGEVERVGVRKLRITGQFAAAVAFSSSHWITISNCEISGATLPWSGYCGGICVAGGSDVRITDNIFFGNGTAPLRSGTDIVINGNGHASERITIASNVCSSDRVAANIACFDVSRSAITSNVVSGAVTDSANNSGYGIVIYAAVGRGVCHDNMIADNHVSDTGGSGIYLASAPNCVVRKNVIARAGAQQSDVTLPVGGISVNGGVGTVISGNTVLASMKDGIVVSGGRGEEIRGNTVDGAGGAGIRLRGTGEGITVASNVVAGAPIGIGDDADFMRSRLIVSDNTVSLIAGGGCAIQLPSATGSIVAGNIISAPPHRAICVPPGDGNKVDQNTIRHSPSAD